ncbi:hypothetical protein TrLO_g832 [Triparma laevis f. longispina]|uniref:Glycoside hydrolase family 5 domain-containing protein n=1 Tax=Triparma laevis f. longispina TaxID=1714387 RepID=A0A9W6ZZ82_9STRA|nr:hypothetical protein TrLO_g832 [Triparma laevis f. longispina]
MKLLFLLLSLPSILSAPSPIKVDPETNHFVDSYGRQRFFHGVNAVYKEEPYHPSTGEWNAEESMNSQDAKQLADWGFNVVRLGVLWSGLEPTQGTFNITYLDEIQKIVNTLKSENIYTILDMHQDVLSRAFCGNGIPLWAANIASNESKAFPLPVKMPYEVVDNGTPGTDGAPKIEDCLSKDFITYYFSGSVSKAFQSLYDNKYGLLDQFVKFWEVVVERFEEENYVLGYEIINEPWAGDIYSDPRRIFNAESSLLEPFYKRVHEAIRRIDDEKIVFYEPLTYDVWPVGFDSIPVGGDEYTDRSAMSYHIYCPLAGGSTTPLELKLACQVIDWDFFHQRVHDIKRIGGGGMMTEWGSLSNTNLDLAELNHILRLADDHLVSQVYWQYKDYHDITCTGDAGISLYPGGEIQDDKVKILARTYAEVVAGNTVTMKFHEKISRFNLVYEPNVKTSYIVEDVEEGAEEGEFAERTSVIRIDREHWYRRGVIVDVDWGEGPEGEVECSDDGRKVRLIHAEDVVEGQEISATVKPCYHLLHAMCTC